ncbi:hypothetical protein IE81DRAFT_322494 [Ceraceosorus guamensis]|uniref:SDE2-like domain-containing protein n=1 Tax=Ceraceosorus guamensis TaxID=1522189 RepID=A0A316W471_9BASI|nr:hypothetical protein IE81DRAFT_322494 [Ceraceosorus guamensis]PWN43421.1 hypothetical protein IE81DRAFT_322494 [Ceraceosorus guamensis]
MAATTLNFATSSIMPSQSLGCGFESASQSSNVSVLLRTFAPLPSTLSLSLPAHLTLGDLSLSLNACFKTCTLRLTTLDGLSPCPYRSLSSFVKRDTNDRASHVELEVRSRLRGGKGGFGSMLRAQGGKMSAKGKDQNTDSCRDLNGRRLSTMKQAKQLAAYIAEAPAREAALNEAQAKKYAKLEKMLGRKPKGEADFVEAAKRLVEDGDELEGGASSPLGSDEGADGKRRDRGEGSSAGPAERQTQMHGSNENGKRQRLEDHEYVEQSREIVEGVRSAVATAMLKKKRKMAAAAAAAAKSKTSSARTTSTQAQANGTKV